MCYSIQWPTDHYFFLSKYNSIIVFPFESSGKLIKRSLEMITEKRNSRTIEEQGQASLSKPETKLRNEKHFKEQPGQEQKRKGKLAMGNYREH